MDDGGDVDEEGEGRGATLVLVISQRIVPLVIQRGAKKFKHV